MHDINLDPNYQDLIYRFNIELFGQDLYHYVPNETGIWFDETSFFYFLKWKIQQLEAPFTITNLTINNSNFTKEKIDILRNTEFFLGDRIYLACDSNSSTKYLITTAQLLAFPYFFEYWSLHELSNNSINILPQLEFAISKFNAYSKKTITLGDVVLLLIRSNNYNYKIKSFKDLYHFIKVYILKFDFESVAVSMRGELYILLNFCYNVLKWFQHYIFEMQKYIPVNLTLEQQKLFFKLEYKEIPKYEIDLDIDPIFESLFIDFFKDIQIFSQVYPNGLM